MSHSASITEPAASGGAVPDSHADVVIKPGYDDRLTNEDLAPLRKQSWGTYNFFAFWMSDVHSVGGYITAGAVFSPSAS